MEENLMLILKRIINKEYKLNKNIYSGYSEKKTHFLQFWTKGSRQNSGN